MFKIDSAMTISLADFEKLNEFSNCVLKNSLGRFRLRTDLFLRF